MGAYGVVYLVSFKGQMYAMKTISKKHMLEIQQADVIIQEKILLSKCKNRFIVNLVVSAQVRLCSPPPHCLAIMSARVKNFPGWQPAPCAPRLSNLL